MGKPLKNGATLKRSAVFSVPLLANASVGVTFTAVVYGTPVYFTQVILRFGRLLASAVEARADARNVKAGVISLARALDERIKGVVSSKIHG